MAGSRRPIRRTANPSLARGDARRCCRSAAPVRATAARPPVASRRSSAWRGGRGRRTRTGRILLRSRRRKGHGVRPQQDNTKVLDRRGTCPKTPTRGARRNGWYRYPGGVTCRGAPLTPVRARRCLVESGIGRITNASASPWPDPIGRSPDRPLARWAPTVRDSVRRASTNGVAGGQAVGASEAAQLVTFVVGLSGLLLALEVGLRRVHRRRGALVQRSDQDGVRRTR